MSMKPWMESFRQRLQKRSVQPRRPAARRRSHAVSAQMEHLEDRALLSAAAQFYAGELLVFSDANESISVGVSATNTNRVEVRINGLPDQTLPAVSPASVTSLIVYGGSDENLIDVSQVFAADFNALTSIHIEGGHGHDTIIGAVEFASEIFGDDGNDTITGGNLDDTITGGNGHDSIFGGDGNDLINAGDGNDTVTGEVGDDTINGGDGKDQLSGDVGDDVISGGDGKDTIQGDEGNDQLSGDNGSDSISGGLGDDIAHGGTDNDFIDGDEGNDQIFGGSGNDVLNGLDDDDRVEGGTGADIVNGGAGNDIVFGDQSNDTVNGGDGDDLVGGGGGNDLLDGGLGDDVISGNSGDDTIFGGGGADLIDGSVGNDLIQSLPAGVAVNDVSILEGNVGAFTVQFTVALTAASLNTVRVNYATMDGTAISGQDYLGRQGQVTFQPGQTTQLVAVTILNNTLVQTDRSFTLVLTNPVNSILLNNTGTATIIDDEALSRASLTVQSTVNAARFGGNQDESAIVVNPNNPQQVFVSANNDGVSLFAARSNDGGLTWLPAGGADFLIADGNDGFPVACCDPTVAWDDLGNLYLGYIDSNIPNQQAHILVSTDAGATFALLTTLGTAGVDQPTIAVGPDIGGTGTTLWATFDEGGIVITGAQVTGLGTVGAFSAPQLTNVGQFGDITIGPLGQVTVTGQSNFAIFTQTDPDGLGPLGLGLTTILPVNVDTFDALPAQSRRTVDAEAGLAYDRSTGLFAGRLYQIYTNELIDESSDTDIFVRYSDDDGFSWSVPVRVNDDTTTRSQFFSKIAVDDTTGYIAAAWVDARNSASGRTVETFASVSTDGGVTWSTNQVVSTGVTNGESFATGPQQLGDYIGLTYAGGSLFVSWADNSNSTGDNPGGFGQELDIYTARVTVIPGTFVTGDGTFTAIQPATLADPGDTIFGGTGNDTIFGASGDDLLIGDQDQDILHGGSGNDTLLGGAGNDSLYGEEGNDQLRGQGGIDYLDGGADNDTLEWTGAGNDTLVGNAGADSFSFDSGNNPDNLVVGQNVDGQLTLQKGNATLSIDGSIEYVTVSGGRGDDVITIGDLRLVGPTVLVVDGGRGDDRINATNMNPGQVRVRLSGGDGNDYITGSGDSDTISGGNGNDTLSSGSGADTVSGDDGDDVINTGGGDDLADGGNGADSILGDAGNDTLQGGADNDTLDGQDGDDSINGSFGDDLVIGSFGNDRLDGGLGADVLLGGAGNDYINGGRDNDTINGNGGNDTIDGNHGEDFIEGGAGNDEIVGGDGNDTVYGEDGNDSIAGNDGNDFLNGDAGDDLLVGGDGNDTLRGGAQNDTMIGNDGVDSINGNGVNNTQSNLQIAVPGEGNDPPPQNVDLVLSESVAFTPELLAILASLDGI